MIAQLARRFESRRLIYDVYILDLWYVGLN